jgi:hypothetical protein
LSITEVMNNSNPANLRELIVRNYLMKSYITIRIAS